MASKEKQDTKESETKKDDGKLLKIDRKDAVSLVGALGFHAAHKASNQVLALRLKKLSQYLETFEGTFTGDQAELKDKVLKAGWEGFEIVGAQPTRAEKASGNGKDKPAKGKGSKAGKPVGQGKKTPGNDRPGVIATIQELITAKPMDKDELLLALVKKFPDRPPAGMAKTIQAQLPNRMAKERGIKIAKSKDGKFSAKGK